MPAQNLRLSDRQLKGVKPASKDYVLTDGDGLQLRVRSNGSLLWNFNYREPVTKKRINIGFGTYPELSLANARKKAVEARELLAQGIDPKVQRNTLNEAKRAETEHTFENVATAWFELKKDSVTPAYAEDIWRSLTLHVFPDLKTTPLAKITAPMVIALLRPIEAKGSLETVKRLSQRLNEIMTYGVNSGLIFANPLSGIRAVFKKPKKENMAALPPEELPELMLEIANASIKRTTRCLIEWQLHTMTRPAEAATTRWAEIDFERRVWTIPPERMKKRRPHSIPLSDHAVALLESLKTHSGHREYVFPADRNPRTHANSQTANMALKRMGFQDRLVSHGMRSMASTILNEHGWDPELIEVALAHVDKDEVRSAYNRADYIERRRPMMAWWSPRPAACSPQRTAKSETRTWCRYASAMQAHQRQQQQLSVQDSGRAASLFRFSARVHPNRAAKPPCLDGPYFEELKAITLSGVCHGVPPVDNRSSSQMWP